MCKSRDHNVEVLHLQHIVVLRFTHGYVHAVKSTTRGYVITASGRNWYAVKGLSNSMRNNVRLKSVCNKELTRKFYLDPHFTGFGSLNLYVLN